MLKRSLLLFLSILSLSAMAQIPPGYYDSAEGLTGIELREALRDIIDNHSIQSYSSLWIHFQTTDVNSEGLVWDMYSDVPGGTPDYSYTFSVDQCGNYSQEGDCYNREHSFPKSWFGGEIPPMYTDLFHLVPTDGYVNGQRGNYPYGEVDSPNWTSTNGSKRGPCSYPGYSATVFEPIDEYKGDFARGYFYMLTRYMDNISGWNSDMLSGDDFSDWAKNMLLEWAANDTVSQKEIDRNNAIYGIQNNRNPFIDHPEYVQAIWDLSSSINEISYNRINYYYSNATLYLKDLNDQYSDLSLYSLSGALLNEFNIQGDEDEIMIDLDGGLYLIDVKGKNSRQVLKLMVVSH